MSFISTEPWEKQQQQSLRAPHWQITHRTWKKRKNKDISSLFSKKKTFKNENGSLILFQGHRKTWSYLSAGNTSRGQQAGALSHTSGSPCAPGCGADGKKKIQYSTFQPSSQPLSLCVTFLLVSRPAQPKLPGKGSPSKPLPLSGSGGRFADCHNTHRRLQGSNNLVCAAFQTRTKAGFSSSLGNIMTFGGHTSKSQQ